MNGLLRAKALSACYETPDCPIVGVLAREALERTRGVLPIWVDDGYHKPRDEVKLKPFSPNADTRLLFEKVYGVSIRDQLRMEQLIRDNRLELIEGVLLPTPDMSHFEARYVVTT